MDTSIVCISLCVLLERHVIGQMLVSHKDGVIVNSSSKISEDSRFDVEHVVDGNADTNLGTCDCCAATNSEYNPWYKVDLIQEYMIQRIHVIGRTDYPHTLYKMEMRLYITESDGTILTGVDTSDTRINELDFTLTPPIPARYITLTLRDRTEYFAICELYVYSVCTAGTFGPDCVYTCGNCKNNESCDGVTGDCSACINGYQSPLCQDCIFGYYGSTCEECGKCKHNDVCDKGNGNCPRECLTGYQGNTCTHECQAGTFGFNCKQRCGMCQEGDVCDIYTGECPNGCTYEYKGSQCLQEINQDTSSNSETSISLPVFLGSLFAVIVVTITIVTVLCWMFYRKRLNKKTHYPANNVGNSIPLSNTSSNYDTLRFENPGGDST